MIFSNSKRNTSLFIIAFLLFTSCMNSDKPATQEETEGDLVILEEKNSTFFLKTYNPENISPVGGEFNKFNVATSKVYDFKVCIFEQATQRKLPNFPFDITTHNEKDFKEVDLKTDPDGCLNWTEEIPFSAVKQDVKPALFIRKIHGRGKTQGMRRFIFELFPWSQERGDFPEFRDLTQRRSEIRKKIKYIEALESGKIKEGFRPFDVLTMGPNDQRAKLSIARVDYDLYRSGKFNILPRGVDLSTSGAELVNDIFKTDFVTKIETKKISKALSASEREDYVSESPENEFAGVLMDLALRIKVQREFSTSEGPDFKSLNQGEFKVQPFIFWTDLAGGSPVLLTPNMPSMTQSIQNGELNIYVKSILPYVPTSGRAVLALKLTPLDEFGQFAEIEDLFDVGMFDDLIGRRGGLMRNFRVVNPHVKWSFQEFVKSAGSTKEGLESGHLRELSPYEFSMFNIKFRTVEAGETATKRTVIYTSTTCVTDERARRVPQGAEFEVYSLRYPIDYIDDGDDTNDVEGVDYKVVPLYCTDKDEEAGKCTKKGNRIVVGPNGCIRFIDKMTHKYYKTEKLVKRRIRIKRKGDDSDKGKVLTVYINPWDEKFGTFGTDARAVSQAFIDDLQRRKKIPTRFFIKDFGYETLRFRYEIDKNMKLQVKKTVLFRMRPLVLRYSNILQGINSIYGIRDGIYLLKLAYQKDYLDPAASVRDIKAKMIKRGIPEHQIDINKQPVLRLQSQIRSTDRSARSVLERDPDAPQMSLVEPPPGGLVPTEVNSGTVITDDIRVKNERMRLTDKAPVLVTHNDPRKKQSLSLVKKLVRVNGGNIITPIEFSVDDLRLLRIRSQLFVQLEPVNQVKVQLVNMASKLIEDSLIMIKGHGSKYTCLPENLQREIQEEKMEALDTLARSIDDNVYISSVEDLKKIFSHPDVVQAFKKFSIFGKYESLDTIFQELSYRGAPLFDQTVFLDDQRARDAEMRRQAQIKKKKEKEEELIRQGKALSNELQEEIDESVTPKWRYSEDGKEQRYSYHDPQFNKLCRETYTTYENCLKVAKEKGFDSYTCKCFDNTASDFEPFETELSQILDKDARDKASVARFVSGLTGKDALAELLTNDFTLNAASSDVSDLDLLTDEYCLKRSEEDPRICLQENDDIQPRTFVGPLTFVKTSNGGALRPTDNLDEGHCVTDDCNTVDPIDRYGDIKNFSYERSKYHGSIAHFADVQVDTFIKGGVLKNGEVVPSYKEYKRLKAQREEFEALLYHFVDGMNLKYISLKNKPLMEPICFDIDKKTGRCLVENKSHRITTGQLLENYIQGLRGAKFGANEKSTRHLIMNESKSNSSACSGNGRKRISCYEPPTAKNLEPVVKMPYPQTKDSRLKGVVPVAYAQFSQEDYRRFCGLMVFGNTSNALNNALNEYSKKDTGNKFRLMGVKRQLPYELWRAYEKCVYEGANALSIERKYKINKTGRYYYLGGKSININLGQSVGVSHSSSVSRNFSVSVSDLIQGVLKTLGVPGKDIWGAWGFSYGRSSSFSASSGTSINQGTFLVMQNAEFDVELTDYEQCLAVKWMEPMIKKYPNLFLGTLVTNNLNIPISAKEKRQVGQKARSGYMICSGEQETQPIAVRETYYYFTQHFVEGDMQDRNDIHNHPWLLSLRGVREYETFLAATHSDHEQAEIDEEETVDAYELVGNMDMVKSDLESVRNKEFDASKYEKFERLRRHSWPLTQLIRTYRRISPTFPGLYTQLDRVAYTSEQWPWESDPGKTLNDEARKEEANCPRF